MRYILISSDVVNAIWCQNNRRSGKIRRKGIYTYYKKHKRRRDSRHWWRRIQSRKYTRARVLTKKGVQVVMVSVLIYLLAGLSNGRNYLWLLPWSLIVGAILISSKKYLRGYKAQECNTPNTDAVLQKTEDEKEMKSTPSRILQIPPKKQSDKDHHQESATGTNPTPSQTSSEDQRIE